MKQSKLVALFDTLDKKELRELDKFLHSPYYNQREDVIRLFQYLCEYGTGNPDRLEKERVFKKVFPGESYREKKIRYTMSFLFKSMLSFMAVREMESDPVQHQLYVTRAMRKRNIQRIFDTESLNTEEIISSTGFRNADYHYYNYALNNERVTASMSQSREMISGFQQISDELTYFFIAKMLKHSCFELSYKAFHEADFNQHLFRQVLEYVESIDFSKIPAVSVYYLGYKTLSSENALPYFRQLRQYIRQHGACFPKQELKDILLLAINFCIRRINAGDEPFKREALEMYKEGLEQKIFIENGRLSRFTYKNIVAAGLGLNEYEWVEQFIESYKHFLEKKYRDSAYCFNLALFHFKKEEYGEAMTLLQQVGTDDVLNNLNARRMLLRIYYDLDEFEALESLLGSFQTYIYRKKGLGDYRELYLNLIRFTRRLLQLDFRDKEEVQSLQQAIEARERVAERNWLLEKLQKAT